MSRGIALLSLGLLACSSVPRPTGDPAPAADPGTPRVPADSAEPQPDTAPPSWDTGEPPTPCTTGLVVSVSDDPVDGSIDLGEAPIFGSSDTVRLTLENPCPEPLGLLGHPDEWLGSGPFALAELPPVRIEPGGSAELGVRFSPETSGPHTGALVLPHDLPGSPFVAELTGTGADPLPLVLVGEGRRVSTTLDYGGTWVHDTWETLEAHTDVMQRGACHGAGTFLSVGGSAEGRWWTSPDGVAWQDHRDPDLGAIAGCAWGGTRFVAAAGVPLSSPDGIVWTVGTGGWNPDHLRAITWAGSHFIAVGDNGRVVRTEDGAAWTTDTHAGTADLRDVAAGAGRVVAVGEGGAVATSADDGETWTVQTVGSGHAWSGVTHGRDGFLIGGGGELCGSVDGVTWRLVNASGVVPMATTGPFTFGTQGDTVHRSQDGGFTWTELKPSAGGPGYAAAVLGGQP